MSEIGSLSWETEWINTRHCSWTRTFTRQIGFCSTITLFYSTTWNLWRKFDHNISDDSFVNLNIVVFPFFLLKLSFEVSGCRVKQSNYRVKCKLSLNILTQLLWWVRCLTLTFAFSDALTYLHIYLSIYLTIICRYTYLSI